MRIGFDVAVLIRQLRFRIVRPKIDSRLRHVSNCGCASARRMADKAQLEIAKG